MDIQVGRPIVTIGGNVGGGLTPEQLARLASDKIITISDHAPQPIRDQAIVFKERMRSTLVGYFKMMAESERQRIAHELKTSGHVEIAGAILRL